MQTFDLPRVFSLVFIGLAFVASLIVLVTYAIVYPRAMLPGFVTIIIGAVLGYAQTQLGIGIGNQQTIQAITHTADALQQSGSNQAKGE